MRVLTYVYRYTDKGQGYLVLDYRSRAPLRWWSASLEEIECTFGRGVRMYFSFSKFLLYTNALIAIISLFAWCSYIKDPGHFELSHLFVSVYPIDSTLWVWTNVIIVILWFLVGPVYYAWECTDHPLSRIVSDHDDTIQDSTGLRIRTHRFGHVGGAFITLLFLALGVGMLYGLVLLQVTNSLFSILVSIGFAVLIQSWNFLSYKVTELERNATWFAFRMSQSVKLVGYKIILASLMYLLLAFVLPYVGGECSAITNSGVQFFLVIVLDFLAAMGIQLALPLLARFVKHSKEGPEFNIAENLLLLSYRQFILYIGVLVFPMLGTLVFLVNLIQYPVDRARLMRICKDPHYIPETPALFLMGFMLNAALAATFTYPNGALWILFFPRFLPAGFQNCTMVAGRI